MTGPPVVVDERVEPLAQQWEAELGLRAALRLALARWIAVSEAASLGYLRGRQPSPPDVGGEPEARHEEGPAQTAAR